MDDAVKSPLYLNGLTLISLDLTWVNLSNWNYAALRVRAYVVLLVKSTYARTESGSDYYLINSPVVLTVLQSIYDDLFHQLIGRS